MDSQIKKDVVKATKGILRSPVMTWTLEEPTTRDIAEAWLVCDLIEGKAKGNKETYRTQLLNDAETKGTGTDKGGQRLDLDGITVIRERRVGKNPDDEKMRALLTLKEIKIADAYDEVKTLVLNPSKVKYLIETGRLTQEEVDALRKVDYALKVRADDEGTILNECL